MARRVVRLGVLLALGLVLQLIENALTLPVLLPGAKLGLANVVTLVVLAVDGPLAGALFGPVRHLLGALVSGTLFLPTFWLGMSGSLAVALLAGATGRRLHLRTVGVLAGAAFQLGQGGALVGLAGSMAVLHYLPPLLALGVGAGWATGLLGDQMARLLAPTDRAARNRPGLVAGILLAGALVLAFFLPFTSGKVDGPAQTAHVLVAGKEVLTLPLQEAKTLPLETAGGRMQIETAPGGIRVAASDCPDQVCVRTGWIDRAGQRILCAPYRVLIELDGGQPDGLDGILH